MRRVGTTTLGASAAYYGGTRLVGPPTRNGQAIVPLVAVGIAGAAAGTGWLLREHEVVGSNPPAEGLTADGLDNELYNTITARESNNKSTFVDNRNIIQAGLDHTAYADGKIAAIDALNNQETQATVEAAAHEAANDYLSTVIENLLKSWNESVREARSYFKTLYQHPDFDPKILQRLYTGTANEMLVVIPEKGINGETTFDSNMENEYTLPNGNSFTIQRIAMTASGGNNTPYESYDLTHVKTHFGPDSISQESFFDCNRLAFSLDAGNPTYLRHADWSALLSDLEAVQTEVIEGLTTWVSNVYGEVQAGTLETSDLLTPREQAELTTDDEGFAQAQADLMALNVSVDLDREAEVYLPDIDATIYGSLGYTGDTSLEIGTVDPSTYDGSFYFTYDISRGEGTWGQYNEGIDGGILTFTAEPYEETQYTVETGAGETVQLTADDFTDEGDGNWTADLSDQLDNAITSADSITFTAPTDETQYETIQLQENFEIKSFTDSEGNEYASSNFERSEPQTDDNYITEEEWKAQQKRHEELIEKYEQSQTGGGGIDLSNLAGLPAEVVVLVVGVVGAFLYGK